jgi:hypothetical protein
MLVLTHTPDLTYHMCVLDAMSYSTACCYKRGITQVLVYFSLHQNVCMVGFKILVHTLYSLSALPPVMYSQWKVTKIYILASPCLPVVPPQELEHHWMNYHETWYGRDLLNFINIFQCWLKFNNKGAHIHEDLHAFLQASWV